RRPNRAWRDSALIYPPFPGGTRIAWRYSPLRNPAMKRAPMKAIPILLLAVAAALGGCDFSIQKSAADNRAAPQAAAGTGASAPAAAAAPTAPAHPRGPAALPP